MVISSSDWQQILVNTPLRKISQQLLLCSKVFRCIFVNFRLFSKSAKILRFSHTHNNKMGLVYYHCLKIWSQKKYLKARNFFWTCISNFVCNTTCILLLYSAHTVQCKYDLSHLCWWHNDPHGEHFEGEKAGKEEDDHLTTTKMVIFCKYLHSR